MNETKKQREVIGGATGSIDRVTTRRLRDALRRAEGIESSADVRVIAARPQGACYCDKTDEDCRAAGHQGPVEDLMILRHQGTFDRAEVLFPEGDVGDAEGVVLHVHGSQAARRLFVRRLLAALRGGF